VTAITKMRYLLRSTIFDDAMRLNPNVPKFSTIAAGRAPLSASLRWRRNGRVW